MRAAHVIAFEKWQGLGNDFVILVEPPIALEAELVQRICDRHFGVGADGILVITEDEGRPRMVVLNADGSRPEMCGNGLRCVAGRLALERGPGEILIQTDAGDKACVVELRGPVRVEVTVEMGHARHEGEMVLELDEGGREHRFELIDMGNPHAITFAEYDEASIDRIGPRASLARPGGVNVEFCRALSDEIEVVVWERGVGRTLACGTGACAVAAAACASGRASFDAPLRVRLPGGALEITVSRESRAVQMRGPAARVFSGRLELG